MENKKMTFREPRFFFKIMRKFKGQNQSLLT